MSPRPIETGSDMAAEANEMSLGSLARYVREASTVEEAEKRLIEADPMVRMFHERGADMPKLVENISAAEETTRKSSYRELAETMLRAKTDEEAAEAIKAFGRENAYGVDERDFPESK